jgi:hypothetical protein
MSADSVRKMLEELHNQNEDLRQAAARDYREIKLLINSGTTEARAANAVNLETARNNAQKTMKDALANKKELTKLQLDYVMLQERLKAAPAAEGEDGQGQAIAEDERAYIRRMAAELSKGKQG